MNVSPFSLYLLKVKEKGILVKELFLAPLFLVGWDGYRF